MHAEPMDRPRWRAVGYLDTALGKQALESRRALSEE